MLQSLLNMQARTTNHVEVARELRESAGRVLTFGAMHEQLYRFGALINLNLSEYLHGLVESHALLSATLEGRAISFKGDRLFWPTSDAPTFGLIVVELVTNALKYGSGTVSVTLRDIAGEAVLTVEDEGNALPGDFEPMRSNGLGMRVIIGLLRGRRGWLQIDRSRGHTCFVTRLHAPAPSPSKL